MGNHGRTHLRWKLLEVGDVLGQRSHLCLRNRLFALAVELAGDGPELARERPGPVSTHLCQRAGVLGGRKPSLQHARHRSCSWLLHRPTYFSLSSSLISPSGSHLDSVIPLNMFFIIVSYISLVRGTAAGVIGVHGTLCAPRRIHPPPPPPVPMGGAHIPNASIMDWHCGKPGGVAILSFIQLNKVVFPRMSRYSCCVKS